MKQSGIQTLCEHLDVKSSVELFIEEVLNLLARETNRYYRQQSNYNETKKDQAWTDTDVAETKKFLGLIIIMGLVKKSEKDEYWCTNSLLCTAIFENMIINKEIDFAKYESIGILERTNTFINTLPV